MLRCFLILVNAILAFSLTCKDENNADIDWFVGYKFNYSYNYIYMDPNHSKFTLSNHQINESGLLKNTFDQIFTLTNTSDAIYGIYNDETLQPYVEPIWFGHMKGDQLAVARPDFYVHYVADPLKEKYSNLYLLLQNKAVTQDVSRKANFVTVGEKLTLIHFSKSSTYGKDLYQDLVAPALGSSLRVESWMHGEVIPAGCGEKYNVNNILSLKFSNPNFVMSSYSDHAKWAVSVPNHLQSSLDASWICVGDINRQFSQFHRGGGTMCINNQLIWKAFYDLINSIEICHDDHQQCSFEKSSCEAANHF